MRRSWIWSAALIAALALMAGAAREPWADPAGSSASVSSHSHDPDGGSGDELDYSSYFRLGRGVAHQLGTHDCRRSTPSPHRARFLVEAPSVAFTEHNTSLVSPRFGKAQRDGTLSSHSTGLPPPAV